MPRLIGRSRAKQLMLTGAMVSATESLRLGLVDRVVAEDELLPSARNLAEQIASHSQLAVGLIKEAIDNGLEMDIHRAFAYEADLFGLCFSSHDQKEGMQAFLEKRPARWRDC